MKPHDAAADRDPVVEGFSDHDPAGGGGVDLDAGV
jgi:hypothetical protein